jgi:hypothetical protein
MPPSTLKKSNEYLEGDFNGDGVSEVLIFTHDEQTHYGHPAPQIGNRLPEPNEEDQCQWIDYTSTNFKEVRLFDLNPAPRSVL